MTTLNNSSSSAAESTMEDPSSHHRLSRRKKPHQPSTTTTTVSTTTGESDGEVEDAEYGDPEVWATFNKSFRQVQSVLDRNRLLIQQVNENHQSRIPDNMKKNVSLIQELNGNISKDDQGEAMYRPVELCTHTEVDDHRNANQHDQTTQRPDIQNSSSIQKNLMLEEIPRTVALSRIL